MTEPKSERLARWIIARRVVDQALTYSPQEWQEMANQCGLGEISPKVIHRTRDLLRTRVGSTKPLPPIDRGESLRGFTG